jgi:hypothetical protein
VIDTTNARSNEQANFKDFWWIANFAKKPLADALGLSELKVAEATFHDVYRW